MKVGDYVKYFFSKEDKKFEVRKVRSLHPEGIPSNRYPMVMLDGRSGVIDQSHCEVTDISDFTVQDGIIFDCDCKCYCNTGNAPCGHCTEHSVGEV